MELEDRLKKLKLAVELKRAKSSITSWPENIKVESVELANLLSARKVAKLTTLNKSTILYWIKKLEDKRLSLDQPIISITKIGSSLTVNGTFKYAESYSPINHFRYLLNRGIYSFQICRII